jgi:hypothetical protein
MNLVIFLFSIITLFHFIYKNYAINESGEVDINKQSGFTTLRYGILMGILIFILNVINVGNKCSGNVEIIKHSLISFTPWVFIFGLLITVLKFFPGWKAPFSNTFGYLFVQFLKANPLIINLFDTLINSPPNSQNKNELEMKFFEKKTLLNNIYKDQSVMLNVITLNNFNSFWNSLFSNVPSAQEYKPELYKIISTKDKVSEFIWYVLISTVAYSMSNRYITTIECNKSSEDLEKQASAIDEVTEDSD